MSTVVLIQAKPRSAKTGQTVDIRLAGGGSRAYAQLGFTDWRAGLANLPRFTTAIGFDQGGLTGGAVPQTAGARFFPSDKALLSALGNLVWDGAGVVMSTGDDEDLAPKYETQMVGTVAAIKTDGGAIALTFADLAADLEKPVLPDTFAGTGDLEGGDDATGRVKRRTWGRVFNVEGRLLDKANSVYEFGDPARGLTSFDMVKDKGRAGDTTVVAWQGSALATLNALRAAAAPAGGAAVAPSIACVKWWTTPSGPLTADLTGPGFNGASIEAASLGHLIATTYSTAIVNSNRAEAAQWVPGPAGVHCEESGETVGDLLDRLLLPVSIVWILDGTGTLSFRRLTWSNPVDALLAQTITRDEVFRPLKTRRVGFQRNYRQHSDAEISATLLLATDATYADGTPIETLKPQEAGANATEKRTAAAIAGQGAYATVNTVGYGSPLLTGFGQLSPLDSIYFGSNFLREDQGGVAARLDAFKTILGQAASIFGQGAFATISSAAYGSSLLTGFGALAPRSNVSFNSNFLLEQDGGSQATLGNFKTLLGTAAGFTGQGAFATLSSAAFGSSLLTGFGALAGRPSIKFGDGYILNSNGASATDSAYQTSLGNAAGFYGQTAFATLAAGTSLDNPIFGIPDRIASFGGFLSADQMTYQGGSAVVSVNSLRPQEAGSNVTESRTASAIFGQGALATRSSADFATQVTGAGKPNIAALTVGGAVNYNPYFRALAPDGRPAGIYATKQSTPTSISPFNSSGGVQLLTGPSAAFATAAWKCSSDTAYDFVMTANGSRNAAGKLTVEAQFFNSDLPEGATYVSFYDGEPGRAGYSSVQACVTNGNVQEATDYTFTVRPPANAKWCSIIIYPTDDVGQFLWVRKLVGLNRATRGADASTNITDGNAQLTRTQLITSLGQAASIAAQGTLATQNNVTWRTQFAGAPSYVNDPYTGATGGGVQAGYVFYANGQTQRNMFDFFPQDQNSNRTENRTAAAFTGQGPFATAPTIGSGNVANYFNFSAFQLGYSITRSDGTTTVTESLVVTQIGVAAAFLGQAALATKDRAGYSEIDVSSLTAQTSDTKSGNFAGGYNSGTKYVDAFGKDMPIKAGGTIYAAITGQSSNTDSSQTAVYNSFELLDAADNSVLASVQLPYTTYVPLSNYIIMLPNTWGARTVRWRLATRGNSAAFSQFSNPTFSVSWKAL